MNAIIEEWKDVLGEEYFNSCFQEAKEHRVRCWSLYLEKLYGNKINTESRTAPEIGPDSIILVILKRMQDTIEIQELKIKVLEQDLKSLFDK